MRGVEVRVGRGVQVVEAPNFCLVVPRHVFIPTRRKRYTN